MDTKLKKFSYSIITKTIAFMILVSAVCFGIFKLCTMISTEQFETFEPTVANNVYDDTNFGFNVSGIARSIYNVGMHFKSEENINAGNLVTEQRLLDERIRIYERNWSDFYNSPLYSQDERREDDGFNLSISMLTKSRDELGNIVATLDERLMSAGQIKFEQLFAKEIAAIPNSLIARDILEYRNMMDTISSTKGIEYYVSRGGDVFSNIEKPDLESIKKQDVYFYEENGNSDYKIGNNPNSYNYYNSSYFYIDDYNGDDYNQLQSNDCAYIVFTKAFSEPYETIFEENRQMTIDMIKIGAALAFFALASFIYLICVTGKKSDSAEIKLNWLDRIYTEVIVASGVLMVTFYTFSLEWFVRYSAFNYNVLLTAITTAITMLFLLSIVRRFKAHKVIHTTICFRLIRAFLKWINRGMGNLRNSYNGGSICHRVVLATVIFGILCCITIFVFPIAIILIIAAAIAAGRAAKDYEAVADGAQKIRAGNLGYNINTGAKTIFTPLIDDLNSIAEGLNNAVENELKSERMKSELITNVSHDIRTPLTSIITYVDLINKEGLESPDAPHYLEIIEQKSQRLKSLTDDLFEVSKAASGNINVELEDVDLTALIKQGMGELDDRIVQSGLDFKVNMPDTAVNVRADGKLIWRVIENLLSNVFKYALAKSRVYIDVTQDTVSAHFIMKNISDSELNVSADELTERFKRGDSARQSEGSGLGLAIAKNLVELQNGTFELTVDGDLFKAEVILPIVK